MQWWVVKARTIAMVLFGWLAATNVLAIATQTLGWWPFKVLLFLCISLLPGLTLLRAMRITLRTLPICILYSFGLSILVLMISGLVANELLHTFGMERPLDTWGVILTWNTVVAALIAASVYINRTPLRMHNWRFGGLPKAAWGLIGLSSLLPIMATFGAWRLNNGSDGALAVATLCLAAVVIMYAFTLRRHLPDGALLWCMFIIGLSILLMTSMRGWDIVGHDIAREFRVFTLTTMNGHWDIALNRDPYNACLSITILPHMYSELLDVSGIIVFKLILQLAFASVVAAVYLLLRRYTPKLGALAGTLLFICYPTFINDSAMLTRQGVAYLFFALAILVISNKTQRWRYKILFLLCAAGAILSHYSTAYMFVALFVLAVVCKLIGTWWYRREHGQKQSIRSSSVLTPGFAAALFLMTFVWYSQVTATSSGLVVTLQKSLANIPALFSDDNKSADVSSALLFAGGKTQADLYDSYLSGSLEEDQAAAAKQLDYMPSLTSDEMPATWLGERLRAMGVDLTLTNTLRQHFAKTLQVLAVAGVAYAAWRFIRHKPHTQGIDFTCLSVASIVLLALMVILPVLSINYGVLRAFQQALIFLILPIALLLMRITQRLHLRAIVALATSGGVLLFLLFTGVTAQLLGGTSPPLTMDNHGLYYGLYYASAADKQSFTWMKQHIPHQNSDVRAANFHRATMHDPDYPFSRTGVLPLQTAQNSHIYLDHAQLRAQRFYTYYESSPLVLTFPLDYFTIAKNQVYSTGSTGVYK